MSAHIPFLRRSHGEHGDARQEPAHHGNDVGSGAVAPFAFRFVNCRENYRPNRIGHIRGQIIGQRVGGAGIGIKQQKGQGLQCGQHQHKEHRQILPTLGAQHVETQGQHQGERRQTSHDQHHNAQGLHGLPLSVHINSVRQWGTHVAGENARFAVAVADGDNLGVLAEPGSQSHVGRGKVLAQSIGQVRENRFEAVNGRKLDAVAPKRKEAAADESDRGEKSRE